MFESQFTIREYQCVNFPIQHWDIRFKDADCAQFKPFRSGKEGRELKPFRSNMTEAHTPMALAVEASQLAVRKTYNTPVVIRASSAKHPNFSHMTMRGHCNG